MAEKFEIGDYVGTRYRGGTRVVSDEAAGADVTTLLCGSVSEGPQKMTS